MIRDLLPANVRRVVYALLGAAVAVNGVLGVVDDGIVAKVVQVAAVLGFGLAAGNTPRAGAAD